MTTFNDFGGKTTGTRVAVAAMGVVSPLGFGFDESLKSLRASKDCVSPVTRFDVENCRCKTAGQIRDECFSHQRQNGRKTARWPRGTQMLAAALDELLTQDPRFKPELTVIGTTSGGMSFGENYYRTLHQHRPSRRAPAWIASYPPQKPVIDAQE